VVKQVLSVFTNLEFTHAIESMKLGDFTFKIEKSLSIICLFAS
jgi:hypothetical protein